MSGKLLIMAGLAVVFGATSYVAGTHYLESQTQARLNELENNRETIKQVELAKVVVATRELKFGETLKEEDLKVVDWPKTAFPDGAFTAISDVVLEGERRVITQMQSGEPILAIKVTGENSRAGLAGIITQGKRAVTIPVDTVNGVGGFVQPGDRVDLVLSKNDNDSGKMTAKIFMENVKVLTVDQQAGSRGEIATVAKSVTLETDTGGAEQIALALNVGRISLLLRAAGDAQESNPELRANPNAQVVDETETTGAISGLLETEEPKTKAISVVEGRNITNYTVSIEGSGNDNKNKN